MFKGEWKVSIRARRRMGRVSMNFGGNAAFCLGNWRIDPALDEISRDDKTIKLEPRTMRVLVCFAERPGEVIVSISCSTWFGKTWLLRRIPSTRLSRRCAGRSGITPRSPPTSPT